jgi:hypothetical protein
MPSDPHRARTQLLSIARMLNVPIEEASAELSSDLRRRVVEEFTDGSVADTFIWSHLRKSNSTFCRDDNAWLLIDDFIIDQPTYMFFNPSDCPRFFRFSGGKDIVDVLHEASFSDIYFVDAGVTFLITYSHHDILTASGTARAWLEALTDDRGNLRTPLIT